PLRLQLERDGGPEAEVVQDGWAEPGNDTACFADGPAGQGERLGQLISPLPTARTVLGGGRLHVLLCGPGQLRKPVVDLVRDAAALLFLCDQQLTHEGFKASLAFGKLLVQPGPFERTGGLV